MWNPLLDNYATASNLVRADAAATALERQETTVADSSAAVIEARARYERLLEEYQATDDNAFLDRAERLVTATFAADRSAQVPHEQLLIAAHNGAAVYQAVYGRHGEAAALGRGAEILRAVLGARSRAELSRRPAAQAAHDAVLRTLAQVDLILYEAAGDASALDDAIRVLDSRVMDDRDRHLVQERADLGAALRTRYELTGSAADLRRSLEVMAEVPLDAVASRQRIAFEVNRASTVAAVARRERSVPGMVAAAHGYRRALEEIPDSDRSARATAEANLGTLLSALYRLNGNDRVADHATTALTEAVALTPPRDRALPKYLSNLGNHLVDVARARNDGGLLAAGVDACRRAMELVGKDDQFRTRYMNNALNALADLHNRTGEDWIVAYALRTAREIVTATPERTHPDLSSHLQSYAFWLAHAARADADIELHDEAVRVAKDAISLCHERGTGIDAAQMTLGRILTGWRQTSAPSAELDAAALDALRAGLAATPADDGAYTRRATALAWLLVRTGQGGTDEAEHLLNEARHVQTAPFDDRLDAARALARLLQGAERFTEALAAYDSALDLLELMLGPAIARRDGQTILARYGTLGADAAACALQLGDPLRALSCTERGKSVLLTQTLGLSPDLTLLKQRAPRLADQFTQAVKRIRATGLLDTHAGADRGSTTSVPLAGGHVRLAVDGFRALVTEIRQLPGFGDFLRGPQAEDLAASGAYGPVVVANIAAARSDLIVITVSGITVVPLPDVTFADLGRRSTAVSYALDEDDGSDAALQVVEDRVQDCSVWLWQAVCAPLIDALDLTPCPDGQSPDVRLWWSLSHLLAYLPVHAAAPDRSAPSMLDYAVSSFTPSVTALLAGRQRAARAVHESHTVLGVAMRTTPGFAELTAADAEIEALADLWPHQAVLLHGEQATSASVTAALRSHHIVHFACHAAVSYDDPFSARLVLSDDETSPLTIWRMVDSGASGTGELAYLSACRSARPNIALPTESLHIASAFYAAGFDQVIGNLWPVEDEISLQACRTVYTQLAESADAGMLRGAQAVNNWGRAQRGRDPNTLTRYASMTHTGI